MAGGRIEGALLVPGMSHVLSARPDPSWARLRAAAEAAGTELRDRVDAWLLMSTQWFTVLGFQFQVRPHLAGTHVDDNWYDTDHGEHRYDLRVDGDLVGRWADATAAAGADVHRTDVEGFPMDTGTLTALRLVDPDGALPVAMASMNLYAGPEAMVQVGETARRAVEASGKRVGVVVASGLSAGVRQEWLRPGQDDLSDAAHDRWNREILDLLAVGDLDGALARREDYARQASVDSQFRALTFLAGTGAVGGRAEIMEYGPIWGTGAAVVRWPGHDDEHTSKEHR